MPADRAVAPTLQPLPVKKADADETVDEEPAKAAEAASVAEATPPAGGPASAARSGNADRVAVRESSPDKADKSTAAAH